MTYFEPLSAEQLEDYYKEWNMTPESLKKDAQYLIEWLEQQPHLPSIKDGKLIIGLIQKCKNRLESAKEVLEITFTSRATIPALMASTDMAEMQYRIIVVEMGIIRIPLPKLTAEGHRVWVFQPSKNASRYALNSDAYMRMASSLSRVLVSQEQSKGAISITDFEGVSAAHVASAFSFLKTYIHVSKMLPRRMIKSYLLNLSPMTNGIFTMAKTLMKEKLGERMTNWTGEPQDLANEISKDILPTEFGGNWGSMEELREKYYDYMMSQRDLIREASELRADLTKKPPDSEICNDLLNYGVDGSFRTLCVE